MQRVLCLAVVAGSACAVAPTPAKHAVAPSHAAAKALERLSPLSQLLQAQTDEAHVMTTDVHGLGSLLLQVEKAQDSRVESMKALDEKALAGEAAKTAQVEQQIVGLGKSIKSATTKKAEAVAHKAALVAENGKLTTALQQLGSQLTSRMSGLTRMLRETKEATANATAAVVVKKSSKQQDEEDDKDDKDDDTEEDSKDSKDDSDDEVEDAPKAASSLLQLGRRVSHRRHHVKEDNQVVTAKSSLKKLAEDMDVLAARSETAVNKLQAEFEQHRKLARAERAKQAQKRVALEQQLSVLNSQISSVDSQVSSLESTNNVLRQQLEAFGSFFSAAKSQVVAASPPKPAADDDDDSDDDADDTKEDVKAAPKAAVAKAAKVVTAAKK